MKRWLFITALVLLLPRVSAAQATQASRLEFDQAATTLAEAQALTIRYYPDAITPGVVAPVTCAGTTSPFVCSIAFPAFTPGPHTITLTAANAAGESLKSTPFSFTFVVIPSPPQNLRLR